MVKEMFDLTGKKAMVTGAGGGIGSTQAKALAEFGAEVALCDLNPDSIRETAAELEVYGCKAPCIPIDITSKASVVEAVGQVTKELGQIDILCNTAGINYRVPILDYPEEKWDRVIDVNLKGMFLVSQAVAPQMIERGWGKIINMSSIMAKITYFNQAAYCSSKGGVDQLTKVMALEWAKSGVRVNAISPTYINTPLVEQVLKDEPERVDFINKRTPMGRLGKLEELMGITVFLACPASDLITGQSISVDGGWTAW